MIDFDDVTDTAIMVPASLFGVVVVLIVLVIALCNDDECSKMSCPGGQPARLLDHACMCVSSASVAPASGAR